MNNKNENENNKTEGEKEKLKFNRNALDRWPDYLSIGAILIKFCNSTSAGRVGRGSFHEL